MKQLFFGIMFIMLTVVSAKAQHKTLANPTVFSLGLEPSLPIGVFGNLYSFGIGGSLQVEHMVSNDLGLTLNAGYLNYSRKSSLGGGSVGFAPILAGVKYYFTPKVYGHGQLGASFVTTTGGGTYFTYSPGIGFVISNNIDALLKFTGMSYTGGSFNSIGLRLAYNFGK